MLGINPVRNLVLPRVVALTLWMPVLALLTFWAGIAGTFTATVLLYDATPQAFAGQLLGLTNFIDLWGSVVKLALFGVLVGHHRRAEGPAGRGRRRGASAARSTSRSSRASW